MVTRIGGLNSNLDTEAIIKTILDAERVPITRLEEKNTTLETQKVAYTELESRASLLQSTAYSLSLYSTWAQKSTESASATIATASATIAANVGDYNVTVSTLAKNHRVGASVAQSSSTEALGYTGTFAVQGEDVNVTSDDTLTSIVEKINTAMENVADADKAYAYIVNNTLVIERKKTGSSNLNITDDGSILQSGKLAILNGDGSFANELQESSGFTGKINGVDVSSDSNTLEGFITGVTFTAKSQGSTTVSVTNDTATVKQLITDFITQYNDVSSYVRTQTAVIDKGSEAAETEGLLQGDTYLANFSNRVFNMMASSLTDTSVINSAFNNLRKIGITVKSDVATEFEISDEKALDSALTDHFDDVKNLFRANTGSTQGIAKQLDTFLKKELDPANGTMTLRVSNLTTNISDNEKKITTLEDKLADREVSLWDHFAAMEEMVGEINNQMNFLLSALGMSSSK